MIFADVRSLSTEEFFREVRDLQPRIAVFDCDGTLWSGDAGSSFMRWTMETGLVSPETVAWIEERYRGYLRGEISEPAICGEMVQMYAGLRVSAMREAARSFFSESIEPQIFPEMRALVDELRSADVAIWAVSSTNDWVIEEGVARFGIPASRVLAATVVCVDGVVGQRILDVPTGEGKVAALAHAGVLAPDAVLGNSVHDAAMLGIARRAFSVNPSMALVERSRTEGWPVYFPATAASATSG